MIDLVVITNVKEIIKTSGLKQCAVAARVGMPAKAFSALLSGRKTFQAKHILPIAEALGVTPNDLFRPPPV